MGMYKIIIRLYVTPFQSIAMLKWFVDGREMAAAIKSPGRYLVEEEHVEVRPEKWIRILMST